MYFLSQTYRQQALSDSIASIYAKFEVPYLGSNNDTYSYNWQDGIRRVAAANQEPDSYGELAYYYHSDHLGSSSYITDTDGEISQHVEYVPFGEVFIEELSSSAKLNTPYLFNGKELDEETGLYYYGARYYDPRTSLWLSTDPMELKYPNVSTYTYCANNPIKFIDPNGADWFVNYQGFFYWENATSVPGFDYAGTDLPDDISPYYILTRINGQLYHKYTNNAFASFGNWLFGDGTFVEHKPYDPTEENFNNEMVGSAIFMGAGKFLGWTIKSLGATSLWKIAPFQRGFIYEDFIKKSFGSSNLIKAKNFPVIDIFAKGVATSVKTLDLTAKSYLKGNRVFSTLKSYIDDLSNFSGADWGHTQITSSMKKRKF